MSPRHRFLYLILVLLIACNETLPSADYVRIAGVAPRLEDAPAARALLVVFWAAWCPLCREETPQLRALAMDPPKGLSVVFVSQDTEHTAVEEFFAGPPEPALHLRFDPDKRLFNAFRVETLPATFLIVDGELRARFKGSRQWNGKELRALLERLIAEEKRP